MKKKIGIIGSGIAGLTLANLLQDNSNFEFVIYEKEAQLNLEEGFGVQLSVNSVSILNKIGFKKVDKNEKYSPSRLDFYSNKKKICDLDLTKFNTQTEKYTTLKRSVLIKSLKENLSSNSIKFGKKISELSEQQDKLKIIFSDNSSDIFDYLVVSDGVFSNTKSIIEDKKFQPNYPGSIAVRTKVEAKDIEDFSAENISLIMGSNFHLVLYPINTQKEFNLVCIIKQKFQKNESVELTLDNTVLKENKHLSNLFKGELKSWPIYVSKDPIKSNHKKVFYAGDAFYTFLPTFAQGASQSIEAVNELFQLLTENQENMENKYFNNRLKRTKLVRKRSELNYFVFHLSNPIFKFLRNQSFKYFIKSDRFINSYLGKIYK